MQNALFFSSMELAEMALPNMPKTKQAIEHIAKRDGWPFEYVTGQARGGKRKVFLFSGLPTSLQAAIQQKQTDEVLKQYAPKALPAMPTQADLLPAQGVENGLTERQRLVESARKGVLKAIEDVMDVAKVGKDAATRTVLTQARLNGYEHLAKMFELARDGRGAVGDLPSERTIKRWFAARDEGGLVPSIPTANMNLPQWAGLFLKHYQQPQKPSVPAAFERFLPEWMAVAPPLEKLPTIHMARRLLEKIGNVSREKGRMGEREIKNIKAYKVRDFLHLNPSDIYSADGHTFDAEVMHPQSGKPFRPEITTIVDIATRKIVGWSIDLAESGLAVLSAISHASECNGIGAIFYVDNGGGYKNAMMTDEATGLMGRLGMTMKNSQAYNSQARGVIERVHQSVWVKAAQTQQTYIGEKMDRQAMQLVHKTTRKATKANVNLKGVPALANIQSLNPNLMMTWPQFMEFCEYFVDQYNNRPHRSLPKVLDVSQVRRHMTPNELWSLKIEQGAKLITIGAEEKHMLFMPQEMRVVQRSYIFFRKDRYFSPELEEYHGDTVRVAYDIHDPMYVWIYDDVGRLICKADWNGNSEEYMPKSVIERAQDKRVDMALQRLDVKKANVEAGRPNKVIEHQDSINLGGITINMNNLSAEGEKVRLRLAEKFTQSTDVVDAELVEAEVTKPMRNLAEEAVWSVPSTANERFELVERLKNQTDLPEAAMAWMTKYQRSHEFKALNKKAAQG